MEDNIPTILVADDDPILLKNMSQWLKQAGYKVRSASTPEAARNELVENDHLDLVILDVRLRDGNEGDESGLELARETAEANIPTLILTAFEEYGLVRHAQTWFPNGTPAHINFMGKNEKGEKDLKDNLLKIVQRSLRGENVFIVHGHDDDAREAVYKFVKDAELNPIILQDQSHSGRTIFQQLVEHPSAAYVIVLMTPDDVGRAVLERNSNPRARQNVIFEFGYFIAKYGTYMVTALLTDENIEMPSDLHGRGYIKMSIGEGWKQELCREMRASGLRIDTDICVNDS